ncbi:hypothetical protein [Martelella alba]|uniref:Uncharacterized protein n=1 Tax=Martelella alba TaxID=2590451 RepID=A0ABY2SK39_9HYPH|nr:hypothetical protein [Martelella alba]TKI03586.1 hypothetical protein FCN80_21145 [Martelella alba]
MNTLTSLLANASGIVSFGTQVTIGGITLAGFEIPERIALPGKQKVVIHQMIGGKRVFDVLGVEYDALTWSGIINGPNASSRVQSLELIRDAGKVVTLTCDDFSFDGIITSFTPVYEYEFRRPYSIEMAVLKRNDAPVKVDALTGALTGLVNSDVGQALGLADVIDIDSVTAAVKKVQSVVSTVSDFAHATVSTIQTIVAPIVAAQNLVTSSISSLESSALQITTLGGLVPGNPISKTITNLLTQRDSQIQLTGLYALGSVLGRLYKNVNSGQTADGVQTITQSGGSLYQVASDQYGDPSLWTSIAAANDLTDPQLTGINTLTIPANPAATTSST